VAVNTMPLSTILQLQCGGQFYGIYHHFQQYYSYNVAVSFMVFTATFNNITVTMWRSVLWYLPPLSTILQLQCVESGGKRHKLNQNTNIFILPI
jgi:hypothetical protein